MKISTQKHLISGPEGDIEAVLDLPENHSDSGYFSVNCHPHSLHGGTMTNKVVHTVSRSIAACGIPSLRFNFRGVGKSAGVYDEGVGEQADLAAAVEWMKREFPQRKLILSGFSFGSYVSAFAAQALLPELLLSVAPPVKRFDFTGFNRPACEWVILMGDQDELVDYADVENWVTNFEPEPELIRFEGASHFFHGRLVELREKIEQKVTGFIGF